MKRIWTIIGIVLIVLLSQNNLVSDRVQASETSKGLSKKEQHKLYVSHIKKFHKKNKTSFDKYKGIFHNGTYRYYTYYAFADIDGNGIDECIVQFSNGGKMKSTAQCAGGLLGRTEIYSIKNGKVIVVEGQSASGEGQYYSMLIFKDSSLIGKCTSGHSLYQYTFYQYKSGTISKYMKKRYYNYMGDPNYYIDGKKVSYKEFYKKVESLKKRDGYTMYKYTASTIQQHL